MKDVVRMIRAWLGGRYTTIPWRSLCILAIVAIYAIHPFDLIPDYIPVIGVIDDAAMVGFLWWSLRKDAKLFLVWEESLRMP